MMKQATTLKPVTEMIRPTPPQNGPSNSWWSRRSMMTDRMKTSMAATIDCASAKPSMP